MPWQPLPDIRNCPPDPWLHTAHSNSLQYKESSAALLPLMKESNWKCCKMILYWLAKTVSHWLTEKATVKAINLAQWSAHHLAVCHCPLKENSFFLPFLFLLSFATLSDLGILHYNLTAWTSSWTSFCDTKRCDNIVKLQGWSSVIKDQCKYDDVR